MKIVLRFAALIAAAAFAFQVHAQDAAAPAVGAAAPTFKLQDQKGDWRALDQYKGKWVVLYFYPKDDTPGCTTEVCTFRDDVLKLRKAGAEVLGVSLDDVKSHAAFAEKYHVPFPLLSDNTQATAKAYGVLSKHPVIGAYAKRETFLIDPEGKVAKHYVGVDPKENSGQVLADLASLKKES
ncbi:MAG: peroxiredoxin [Rudaea sp.]|nr:MULTISPECIES: peroxiredoxin [unclassified Rudaea]MBN8885605.1 peroxiredoxin [Rudaea sp.]MBR0345346.1 peroxiredoxin [Rudaea sp.]